RRAVAEVAPVVGEDRADARLVEDAGRGIDDVAALDEAAVERVERGAGVERAAAAILPGAGDGGGAGGRGDLRRAVARARETVAEADEAALGPPVEPGEGDDLLLGHTADRRGPRGIARGEVPLELLGNIGVFRQVGAVGVALLEEDMHDAAGQRRVGAGP